MPAGLLELWDYLGRFHPLLVHFPIGLILVAAAVELWALPRGEAQPDPRARLCLCLGALAAIFASVLGWARADGGSWSGPLADQLFWHRWIGVGSTALALAAVAAMWVAQRGGSLRTYRVLLFGGALSLGIGAHFGATLVHGLGYYRWPEKRPAAPETSAGAPTPEEVPRADPPPRPEAPVDPQPVAEGPPASERLERPEGPDAARPEAGAEAELAREAFAILERACFACHGPEKQRQNLRLDHREGLLAGSKFGPVLEVGAHASSLFYQVVSGEDELIFMPPEGEPLAQAELDVLARWIDAGVPYPE